MDGWNGCLEWMDWIDGWVNPKLGISFAIVTGYSGIAQEY